LILFIYCVFIILYFILLNFGLFDIYYY